MYAFRLLRYATHSFVRHFVLVVLGGEMLWSAGRFKRATTSCCPDTVICFETLAGIIESMYHRSDLSTLGTYPPGLS